MTIGKRLLLIAQWGAIFLLMTCLASCQSTSTRSTTPVSGGSSAANADPLATKPLFDSAYAYSTLVRQCAFGPRVPNTVAHKHCLDYMVESLKPYADEVLTQNFSYHDGHRNVTLDLTNVLAVYNPKGIHTIMLCAHWDSRPTADEDMDIANRTKPIPGADDGASGVAVLLALARVFHQQEPADKVVLAFWDAEDWGPDDAHMYIGAEHFANDPGNLKPDKEVLIDMIGNTGVRIPEEQFSLNRYPALVNEVFQDAADLGYQASFPQVAGPAITDDQICMMDAGIPTIDLIDFDYAYWHTLDDTPDKCSPDSLTVVGRTLEKFVYDQTP